ncbi:precorrin-3B synthase [Haloechinothrix halophila]|uniref:precorrin-3B synthase n=1 Tax=Haloechinothrix halophila TaxID=1069073 RepID=UPI000A00567A
MPNHRTRATDACPGALTTHAADDGALARVRLPGGRVSGAQLGELASCAEMLGDGTLHLTSRANVQLRGVCDTAALAERLADAGLLPSATHERVRNVVASPASGLLGGLADVRPLVAKLDSAICARPALAELPGRFWFGLDDGRGDVGGSFDDRVDVCWRAVSGDSGALLLAGEDTGVRVPVTEAVDVLVDVAAAFVRCRGEAWQVRELDDTQRSAVLAAACGERHGQGTGSGDIVQHRDSVPPLGTLRQDDGRSAVQAGLRFGTAMAEHVRLLAEIAGEVIVTPWRSVLLPDLDPEDAYAATRRLHHAGLLVEPHNPAASITACIGSQGCGKALADVRVDATNAMSELATVNDEPGVAAHFAGCTRRCGRPSTPAVDVLAADDGYLVDGDKVPVEELADVLARKRATGAGDTAPHATSGVERGARPPAWEAQKGRT